MRAFAANLLTQLKAGAKLEDLVRAASDEIARKHYASAKPGAGKKDDAESIPGLLAPDRPRFEVSAPFSISGNPIPDVIPRETLAPLAFGKAVGLASQVPVGGGMIFPKAQVVVTQPTAGEFKAFDANCTHQACLVVEVADGTINCACHGAKFSITDGSNTTFFPITDPLRPKSVTVSGGKIIVA